LIENEFIKFNQEWKVDVKYFDELYFDNSPETPQQVRGYHFNLFRCLFYVVSHFFNKKIADIFLPLG